MLNLPEEVTFTNGNSTKFFYSAEGEKLRAVHTTGSITTQIDYCGNIIYEAGEQKYLLNQEGYYDLEAGGYHYYLKDHLGNNRVVITQSGSVEQTTHYYPYGGTFASTSNGSNTQPYKYNGKELDAHNGLYWYDYGARHYDPAIARWTTQDPLAEKYYGWNQYNYCGANPVILRDKDGKAWDVVVDAGFLIYDIGSAIYSHVTGDHDGAKQQWVSAGVDAVSMLIPGVTAPMAKGIIKGFDKVADAISVTNRIDDADVLAKATSYSKDNFRRNLVKITGRDVKSADAHHIFPKKFEKNFNDAGIDIHDPQYGVWWEMHDHRKNSNPYNAEWEYFLKDGKTKEEIMEKAKEMARKYGYELNIKE